MKRIKFWLPIGIGLCCLIMNSLATEINPDSVASGLQKVKNESRYNFFNSEEPLRTYLQFSIKELMKSKKEPVYIPATIKIFYNENDTVTADIKIKARGFMRLDYCQFPPVFLKFCDKKASINGYALRGTYKIVTPCMQAASFEHYVLKEYLAYKLYNQVSQYSLLTRLLIIRIQDSEKPGRVYESYGFMIEDLDMMAARTNSVVINNNYLFQQNMEENQMNRVALFNYMIGNTDWSVLSLHNIKILKSMEVLTNKGIPVVYDFDYAGIVDAEYAVPSTNLPIKDVRERYYQGICENSNELGATIEEFKELKSKFLGTIEEFDYLHEPYKKEACSYIEKFYKLCKNDDQLIHMLNRTCKHY